MKDDPIWTMEESLWTGDAAHYHTLVAPDCVMVLPSAPFIMSGEQAIDAVSSTPRWSAVQFSDQRRVQPRDDLVVIAYRAAAMRDGADAFDAYCTTTWHRTPSGDWRVVQHQQLPPIIAGAG